MIILIFKIKAELINWVFIISEIMIIGGSLLIILIKMNWMETWNLILKKNKWFLILYELRLLIYINVII